MSTVVEFVQGDHEVLELLIKLHDEDREQITELLKTAATACGASHVLEKPELSARLVDVVVAMAATAHEKTAATSGVQRLKENVRQIIGMQQVVKAFVQEDDKHDLTDYVDAWEDDHQKRYEFGNHGQPVSFAPHPEHDAAHAREILRTPSRVEQPTETTALMEEGQAPRVQKAGIAAQSLLIRDNYLAAFLVAIVFATGLVYAFYIGRNFPLVVEFMGPWVLVSRGSAMSLCIITSAMLMLMSKGFLTYLHATPIGRITFLALLVERRYVLHKYLGTLLPLFAGLHILGHLVGSLPALIESESLEQINASLTGVGAVTVNPMSWRAIAQTRPAWTGALLVLILVALGLASRDEIRKTRFRTFMILHECLVPAWLIVLALHGSRQWLGIGIPLVIVVCGIPALLYALERLAGVCARKHAFSRVIVKKTFVYVEIDTHKSFEMGQFALLCVPEINHEWHPFTICSSPHSGAACFLIAVAGDWCQALKARLESPGPSPAVYVRGGYVAPAQKIPGDSYMVFVGSGAGITPFLSALQHLVFEQRLPAEQRTLSRSLLKARFLWVTREPEDFAWAADYIRWLRGSVDLKDKVSIELVLTRKLEKHGATERKVLWQALKAVLEEGGKSGEDLKKAIGVPTKFGRPNFEKELSAFAEGVPTGQTVSVFVCGNPMLVASLNSACSNVSKTTECSFVLHVESF
jgi:predicted ferric reductase